MLNAKMMLNEKHNGVEIYFDNKPGAEVRENLKNNGFKWHNQKKCWYAKNTPERLSIARNYSITNAEEMALSAETETPSNDYGVRVGDIFSASWGYEQTNVDFFQVIELVGKRSVRVREVRPQIIDTDYHCSLSWDHTYKLTNEILPPAPYSVFIKDQEKGDLKRIDNSGWKDRPCIKIASHTWAYKETEEVITLFESHYA